MNKQTVHITTSDVAAQFGVDVATVRRWIHAGTLTPTVTTPGGHYRFSQEAVSALAERSAVRHAGQRSQKVSA